MAASGVHSRQLHFALLLSDRGSIFRIFNACANDLFQLAEELSG